MFPPRLFLAPLASNRRGRFPTSTLPRTFSVGHHRSLHGGGLGNGRRELRPFLLGLRREQSGVDVWEDAGLAHGNLAKEPVKLLIVSDGKL